MGKGQIISGGTDGLYQVQVLYNRDRYDAMIVALNTKKIELIENRVPVQTKYDDKSAEVDAVIVELNLLIAELAELYTDLEALQSELSTLRDQLAVLEQELQDLLDQEPPATPEAIAAKRAEIAAKKIEISDKQTEISDKQKEIEEKQAEVEEKQKEANSLSFEFAILGQQLAEIDLQITSIEKRVQYLEENMPADGTVSAWCADLTEDLTGEVGTVEIPGERLSPYGILQIQPGYEDNADYDQDRDGQLFPTIATTPAQAFYNAAMLSGWQKWQPNFRHGTITAITGGLGSVTLDASVKSSQQDLNINRAATLTSVEFEYMSCDDAAFAVDDVVLVMFSITPEMAARLVDLITLQSELIVLNKELSILKLALATLEADGESSKIDLYVLQAALTKLQNELADLIAEGAPQSEIDAKNAEITAKQAEITAHQEADSTRAIDISEKQTEITAKEGEIIAKKTEITTKKTEITTNMQDFANPKIIGFKTDPKPCEIVIPYLFASENSFDSGGILICNGGGIALNKFDVAEFTSGTLKFLGPYDLFSPYGPVSYVSDWWYQPRYYTPPGGSQITLEWQVKEFTDGDGVFRDEYPWMSGGGYDWDPTFYESYDDLFETEKPYNFEKDTAITRGGEFAPDYYTWTGTSSLGLEGNVFVIGWDNQWYTANDPDGNPAPDGDWWYHQGVLIDRYDGCLDQTDISKYGLLYTTKDFYGDIDDPIGSQHLVPVAYSNPEMYFVGLGHNQQIPGWGGSYVYSTMRLYNINGQYVCLFSIHAGDMKIIGSAVEGGDLTITDVSAGIYFDGEYRDMFTGSRSNTLGLILKR